MENASKALIIAGSILLSILIIALGMYIFGQAGSSTDTSQLSALEVSSFNGKFDKYKGTQRGSMVGDLIDALISNARSNDGNVNRPTVQFFGVEGGSTFTRATAIKTAALTAKLDFDHSEKTSQVLPGTTSSKFYIESLKTLKSGLESSHRYKVDVETNENSDLVDFIGIAYDL